jgi:hypothetical protein
MVFNACWIVESNVVARDLELADLLVSFDDVLSLLESLAVLLSVRSFAIVKRNLIALEFYPIIFFVSTFL